MGNTGGEPIPGKSGPPAKSGGKELVKPSDVAKRYVSPPPGEPEPPPSIISPSSFITGPRFEVKPPPSGAEFLEKVKGAYKKTRGKLSGVGSSSNWRQQAGETAPPEPGQPEAPVEAPAFTRADIDRVIASAVSKGIISREAGAAIKTEVGEDLAKRTAMNPRGEKLQIIDPIQWSPSVRKPG